MILLYFQNSRDDLLPKKLLKDNVLGIIEKDDIHSRKDGISSGKKIKREKEVYSVKYQ